MVADVVTVRRLVQRGDEAERLVQQRDEVREGVAEESRDPADDVDARPAQILQRYDLESGNASALRLPPGAQTEERKHLGDVISMRAHRARPPDGDADAIRIPPLVAHVSLDQRVRQLLPYAPRREARKPARIDRVEVAARRQYVCHAACWRAARSGRYVSAVERVEHVPDLLVRPPQVGHELTADEAQRALDAPPALRWAFTLAQRRAHHVRYLPRREAAIGERRYQLVPHEVYRLQRVRVGWQLSPRDCLESRGSCVEAAPQILQDGV